MFTKMIMNISFITLTLSLVAQVDFKGYKADFDKYYNEYNETRYIEGSTQGSDIKLEVRNRIVSIFSGGGRGTGYILEPGVIITAAHVVSRGKAFRVLHAGFGEATYYVKHIHKGLDLAILVDSGSRVITSKSLNSLRLTGKNKTSYAYGYGKFSKLMKVKGKVGPYHRGKYFRSYTLPFVSGMSGGPILGESGRLIGIVSAGYPLYHDYSKAERKRLIKIYKDYLYFGVEANQSEVLVGRILTYPAIGVSSVALITYINFAVKQGVYKLNEIRVKGNK